MQIYKQKNDRPINHKSINPSTNARLSWLTAQTTTPPDSQSLTHLHLRTYAGKPSLAHSVARSLTETSVAGASGDSRIQVSGFACIFEIPDLTSFETATWFLVLEESLSF